MAIKCVNVFGSILIAKMPLVYTLYIYANTWCDINTHKHMKCAVGQDELVQRPLDTLEVAESNSEYSTEQKLHVRKSTNMQVIQSAASGNLIA